MTPENGLISTENWNILIVEDESRDALVAKTMATNGLPESNVTHVESLAAALPLVKAHDLVLTDLGLEDSWGIETVKAIIEAGGRRIVVLTGAGDLATAKAALRAGASDYLVKGSFSANDLRRSALYAMARAEAIDAHATSVRIEAKRQAAAEMADLRGALINHVSHELRTPLTPMVIQLDILRRLTSDADDPQFAKSLDVFEANLERLQALTRRFSLAARLVGGRAPATVAVQVHAVVASVLQRLDGAAFTGIEITGDADASAEANEQLLAQSLEELVRNQAEHADARATIDIRGDGDMVTVAVQDDGAGWPAGDDLFTPLAGSDTGRVGQARAGLGLYLTRAWITAMGGELLAESPGVGQGACFTIRLPAA